MEYATTAGMRLEVGRIPRQKIDNFIGGRPLPEPPTRTTEVFGGDTEEVPILDDPGYRRALLDYYITFGHDQVDLIADAVQIIGDVPLAELEELRELGLAEGDGHADLLRHVVLGSDDDLAAVVELVMYQSTVTERGIAEAAQAFNVTWMEKPVLQWGIPGSYGRHGAPFEARKAAQFSRYNWHDFCALSGPEQSAIVAFYRLSTRLEWLMAQQQR
jgi:hypothetical protein